MAANPPNQMTLTTGPALPGRSGASRIGEDGVRILFPYMARWHSANRTRYHHLLTALARLGHRVTVLQPPPRTGARETNFQEMAVADVPGIEVRDLPVPAALWRRRIPLDKLWKKGFATLAARRAVRELAGDSAFDVILLYNVPQVVLARPSGAVVAVDIADDLLAMLGKETGPAARAAVLPAARMAWKKLLRAADVVTAASERLAAPLAGRATVLPNGADLEAVTRADGRAIRGRFPAPIAGYVGAFEYFVDFDLVLETAARLDGECTFLLVGGGRDWERVRGTARRRGLRNVHFTGYVPYPDALNHMAALDVALIPFSPGPVADAASPLKLFEYAALGRPVVCTPAEEVRRVASDWAFFGSTPDAWAGLIRDIVRNPDRAAERARRGRAEVESTYRWDRLAERFEELLEGAVAGRKTRSRA
jgi:glycosyltransferase involved in cell wall biosynthesis